MAPGNHYHSLHFIPATERWEMPPALERASQQLVRSGRLRINADTERNFVRHGTSDSDATFTARELNDPALLPRTLAALKRHVPPSMGEQGVQDLLERMRRDLFKARGIDTARELKVARVLVQSAHPAVVQLVLQSGAEIFVSYAHRVGDLLAVHEWQTHGTAGGLQTTLDSGQRVFISCGGDPFFAGEHKHYVTDGWPALARMVVIGAQELGHFADLIRNGQAILGRYSLSDIARDSRLRDMAHLARWQQLAQQAGLAAQQQREASLAFYNKRGRYGLRRCYWRLRCALGWRALRSRLKPHGMPLTFRTFPAYRRGEALALFLDDMAFNLAPDADAYRRADPEAEAAIATIEAVARVPQQGMKWGADAVLAAWPHLAPVYTGAVIPGCIAALDGTFPSDFMPAHQKLSAWLRRRWYARPDYHP